jgi:hypothetical protein
MRSLMRYRKSVARRTLLDWTYALIGFFGATYFLRMAAAAESYLGAVETTLAGGGFQWDRNMDDARFAPTIPYAHRDTNHARLMKRLPALTAELQVARAFARATQGESNDHLSAADLGATLSAAVRGISADRVFAAAALEYPIGDGSARGAFKLSESDKQGLLAAGAGAGVSPFIVFARLLNFEDMSRRSNNVLEWQFYSTLARSREHGFAEPRTSGDEMFYTPSRALLVALVHCHCAETTSQPTMASFVESMISLGFVFDGAARVALQDALTDLGLLETLADASDAKRILPVALPGGES